MKYVVAYLASVHEVLFLKILEEKFCVVYFCTS